MEQPWLSQRISQLTAPPRRVPPAAASAALMGITGTLGAIFVIVGLVMVLVFLEGATPIDEIRLMLSSAETQGTITNVEGTNTTINDVPVYRYTFTYRSPGGETLTGQSHAPGSRWSPENRVTVEYVPGDPSIARIQGTMAMPIPLWAIGLMLMFPATGAVFFASAAISGTRQATLLRWGEIVGGKITSQQPTSMSVNNVPVMAYTYEFETPEGDLIMGTSKSLPNPHIGDETLEPVLYLPHNPERSMLVDALPLRYPLDVDTWGQWVAHGSRAKTVWCVLAYTGVFATATVVLLVTLGIL